MNKKLLSNTFSSIQYLGIPYAKFGLKLVNMTLPYKFGEVKFVAGQPALSPEGKATAFERLGSERRCKCCVLERSSKTSKRRCFCIYCVSFDNEADCPERAYIIYDSFPRILYHPQGVLKNADIVVKKLEKANTKTSLLWRIQTPKGGKHRWVRDISNVSGE